MDFLDFIHHQFKLSENDLNLLQKHLIHKSFSHKEIILEPENNSKNIFFVVSGIVRIFYHSSDKDVTLYFAEENDFSVPVDSIFFESECKFGIQSIGETQIVKLNSSIFEEIQMRHPEIGIFINKLLLQTVKRFTDYIYSTNFKTPRERFDDLLANNPSLFNKVPLGFIASYLGMTQETLSRLRSAK